MYRFYYKLIAKNSHWIRQAAAWAGGAFVIGFLAFLLQPQLLPQLNRFLDEVFRDILGSEALVIDLKTALLIFQNNLLAAVTVLFFGIVLGLVPVASLALNFFILGFLLSAFILGQAASNTGFIGGLFLFLVSVLPHGVLEIPAFVLAAGFGMRLGFFWQEHKEKGLLGRLALAIKENLLLIPLLIVLFFLASLIEVFVTGNLIKLLLQP